MAPIKNSAAVFNSVPKFLPVLNETIVHGTSTIDLDTVPLNGGILTKTLYLSIDLFLRIMMRSPEQKSWAPAYEIGKPIWGYGVASVLRSETEGVQPGDVLYVYDYPFQEYNVLPSTQRFRVIKNEAGIPPSVYIGILGMPGQTAFYGLELIGKPVKGETIYVSSGASAVGSLVAQLAKAKGLKVIASAGSDDKVAFMKSIGVDVAFNYKTESVADILTREGPINVYWDNVGGATLEAALDALSIGGRVIACGVASEYNSQERHGVKNTSQILFKRLRLEGLMVPLAEEIYEGRSNDPVKFLDALVPLVKSGQIKWSEQVFDGIGSVGEANVVVQNGNNTAKVVVKVADA